MTLMDDGSELHKEAITIEADQLVRIQHRRWRKADLFLLCRRAIRLTPKDKTTT